MPKSQKPEVAIIGGGATGLTAALRLLKMGADVTVIERSGRLGGLADSFMIGSTPLEQFYHHIFTTDKSAIALIKELGISDKLKFYPSNNGVFYHGQAYAFSTPWQMLQFKPVSLLNRLRFAATSAYLKLTLNWRPLEKQLAVDWMYKWAGKQTTDVIWKPLIVGKFGQRANDISMAWLWARIHYRSFKLGYLKGGFQQLYDVLAQKVQESGGKILLNQGVESLSSTVRGGATLKLMGGKILKADAALATIAEPLFNAITNTSPKKVKSQDYLGATCFTLELDRSLIPVYWLTINDTDMPFLAVVEHTNMVGTQDYAGRHVVYVGNYVPVDDWRFTTDPDELLKKYIPYLQKINPQFKKNWIKKWHFAKAPFAQAIITRDFAKNIPPQRTALPHVFLANMGQIHPQDRGQNFAIAAANKIVADIAEDIGLKQ